MKPPDRSDPNPNLPRLFSNPRVWTWGAILLSVLVCASVSWLHLAQRQVLGRTVAALENIHRARIDLAEGFLHLSLSGDPSAPFNREQGLALLQQAISSFERASAELDPMHAGPVQEFGGSVRSFSRLLAEPETAGMSRRGKDTRLRVALHALNSLADRVDTSARAHLLEVASQLDSAFVLVVSVAGMLLAGICGTVFVALRANQKSVAALKESSQRLQLATRASQVGLWDWDLLTDRVYYSPEWKSQIGYEDHEISDDFAEWQSRVHPDDLDRALGTVRSFIEKPWPGFLNEFRFRHKDGSYRWILAMASLFHDDQNKPIRMMGCHLDVTGRVQEVRELERLKRLHAALGQLNQAVVRGACFEKFLEQACRAIVNEGGFTSAFIGRLDGATGAVVPVAISGVAADYLRGIAIYADDRPEGRGPTGTCIRERRPYVCNDFVQDPRTQPWRELASRFGIRSSAAFPVISADQVWGALAIYAHEIGFFGDKEVQLLEEAADDIGFALDNMERERLRRRAEDALRQSEASLASAQSLAKLGSWELDLSTRMGSWSAEMFRLFGCDPMSGVPAFSKFLEMVHPEDRHLLLDAEQRAVQGGEPITAEFRRHPSREPVCYFSGNIHPVRNAEGCIVRLTGTLLDITERKLAELQHEKLQGELFQAQKLESVGRLAGGVAHDFNNMLSVIIGHADLALDRVPASDPLRQDLQEIRTAAQRSAELTRQLLTFARRQTVSPKVLDLNDSVAGMLKLLARLIGEDIELAWMPGHNLWRVRIDPTQVDQILANLAVNARDAISGAGSITIRTANVVLDDAYCAGHPGSAPGEHVCLTVSDSGSGIGRDDLEHIFEPFFTTKDQGKGTGLGLATVYGIVKQNNGFINVDSEFEKGTTFAIYLAGLDINEADAPADRVAPGPQGGKETILFVEDEKAIRHLGETTLKLLGYTVLTASSPIHALRIAAEYVGAIDLLITDVVMPEMSGRKLAERLHDIRPSLKCLYMSGYTADIIAHHGVLDEGVHFMQKPFSRDGLAGKIREVLEHPPQTCG